MPGKVNPVLCEVLIQACHYANGLCQTVARCGGDGQLELNATLPIMAHCLHEAIDVLDSAIRAFTRGCVMGLKADASRCRELVERSLMQVTVLAPVLGYDLAAAIAREALATGKSLREVVLRRGLMSRSALDRALNPARMTRGGAARAGKSRAS
jgi:fumarate hydratase class II